MVQKITAAKLDTTNFDQQFQEDPEDQEDYVLEDKIWMKIRLKEVVVKIASTLVCNIKERRLSETKQM